MMHPALDPDLKAFRQAESDVDRAIVLLTAPIETLLSLRVSFERYALAVGFQSGLDFLAALDEAHKRRRHRGCVDTLELSRANTGLLEFVETVPVEEPAS